MTANHHAMDSSAYLNRLHADSAALLAAARLHAEPPIPAVLSCPGWRLTDLVLHLGAVHRHTTRIVANHEREHVPISPADLGWLDLEQPYLHWLASEQAPASEPLPPYVLDWFARGAARMEDTLRAADPDEPIWTWSPDKRVAHYPRMMAIETAIHRWDAQHALGGAEPIDGALARDAIDHAFDVMLPARRAWKEPRAGAGETYHFYQTDGGGEWLVRFNPAEVTVRRERGDGDVSVRGAASDLLLFLWRRIPAGQLEIAGDASLLDRFFELVPPR